MAQLQNTGMVQQLEKQALDQSIFARFVPSYRDFADMGLSEPVQFSERAKGLYDLHIGTKLTHPALPAGAVIETIDQALIAAWSASSKATRLDAALIAYEDQAVVILGKNKVLRTHLACKLIDADFRYFSLTHVGLHQDGTVDALRSALACPVEIAPAVMQIETFRNRLSVQHGNQLLLAVPTDSTPHMPLELAAILVIDDEPAPDLTRAEPLSHADIRLALQDSIREGGTDTICEVISTLALQVPAIKVTVSQALEPQLAVGRLLKVILHEGWDGDGAAEFMRALAPKPIQPVPTAKPEPQVAAPAATQPPQREIPAACPPAKRKFKLTVGMATYDDFDGVYFSIQGLRVANPTLLDDVEFVVVDNNPTGPCAQALKDLASSIPNYRYVPYIWHKSTAVRDFLFREAAGEYVLCMDCHVLLMDGVFAKLLAFIDEAADRPDFYQGPLMNDSLRTGFAFFDDTVWSKGMFGRFAIDPRAEDPDAPPFDIPMQGLGLLLCRKDVWPGINPRFRGFGGEEGYVQERVRQRGGRTLCLPFLRWLHRFPRPMGVPYPMQWEHRIRNYIIGHLEVGWDMTPMKAHFAQQLGEARFNQIVSDIMSELDNPFNRFGAMWQTPLGTKELHEGDEGQAELARLGLSKLVSKFPVTRKTMDGKFVAPENWLQLIAYCRQYGFETILLIDDDLRFIDDPCPIVSSALDWAQTNKWDVMHFGEIDAANVADSNLGRGVRLLKASAEISVLALHSRAFAKLERALQDMIQTASDQAEVAVSFKDVLDLCNLKQVASRAAIVGARV